MFNFILPKLRFRCERWKWNNEYRIYVSNLGNFKNEFKQNLPIRVNGKGYCSVYSSNIGAYIIAHRLVLKTWRPALNEEELTVDHLNHNKRDNSIFNLEWVTKEENLRRAECDREGSINSIIKDNYGVECNSLDEMIDLMRRQRFYLRRDDGKKKIFCADAFKSKYKDGNFKNAVRAALMNKVYCGSKWKIERYENDE